MFLGVGPFDFEFEGVFTFIIVLLREVGTSYKFFTASYAVFGDNISSKLLILGVDYNTVSFLTVGFFYFARLFSIGTPYTAFLIAFPIGWFIRLEVSF